MEYNKNVSKRSNPFELAKRLDLARELNRPLLRMDSGLARQLRRIDQVIKNHADRYAKKRNKIYKKIKFSSDVVEYV